MKSSTACFLHSDLWLAIGKGKVKEHLLPIWKEHLLPIWAWIVNDFSNITTTYVRA